jgi:diguanylate cyclase (GGDEF)-like protein/PAS domain S-box-containing protein
MGGPAALEEDDGDALPHEVLAPAIGLIPMATLVADLDGRVSVVNRAWLEMSGLSEAESEGPRWVRVVPLVHRRRLVDLLARVSAEGGSDDIEVQIDVRSASRWTRWTVRRYRTATDPFLVMVVVDIDAERTLEGDLRRLASRDPLTGLANRAEFLSAAGLAMIRDPNRVGMVYVDLDRFKKVNDAGGHLLGDQVLAVAAERLQGAVRPRDLIARVGGDEFAVLCEGVELLSELEAVAARLRSALREPITVGDQQWSIGATTGVAVSGTARSPEDVLDAADRAMYGAKANPRPQADPLGDTARRAITRIYAVSLDLVRTAQGAPPPVAAQLESAVAELDSVIAALRLAAWSDEEAAAT